MRWDGITQNESIIQNSQTVVVRRGILLSRVFLACSVCLHVHRAVSVCSIWSELWAKLIMAVLDAYRAARLVEEFCIPGHVVGRAARVNFYTICACV
jgi:hypothetical protein